MPNPEEMVPNAGGNNPDRPTRGAVNPKSDAQSLRDAAAAAEKAKKDALSASSAPSSFENGIKGFEKLELLKPPVEGTLEKPAGTLTPKVRRSIERKLFTRQNKIEKILAMLATADTPGAFSKLVFDEKNIDDISALLNEQAAIAEKESLGNIDHLPFQKKVKTIEDLSRQLSSNLRGGASVDIATEVGKLKKVLIPQPIESSTPVTVDESPKVDVGDPRERMADELLSVALKDPETMQKVGDKLPQAAREAWERKQARKQARSESEREISTFDDVQTFNELDKLLLAGRTELQVLTEGKELWLAGRTIADIIFRRVQEFEGEKEKNGVVPEKKIQEFLSSFINTEAREAIRRAFVDRGLLKAEFVLPSPDNSGAEDIPPHLEVSAEGIVKEFETILKKVAETESFERSLKKGSKPIKISGVDFEKYLREKLAGFASPEFTALSPEAQKERVTRFIASVIEHTELQQDLRSEFTRLGILKEEEEPTQEKEAVTSVETSPTPSIGGKEKKKTTGSFARTALRAAVEQGDEDYMTLQRHITASKRGRTVPPATRPASGGGFVSPPSAEVSPHDALMAGLPVKEAEPPSEHDALMAGLERIATAGGAPVGTPPTPEAPRAPEAVQIIASPDAGVSQEVLADPARFDIGKAMDVAGFSEFLAEAEASGAKIDMANEAAVRKHFEAFATKDALAGKVAELCVEKILGERGIALGDEGVAAVKAYLERQAHLHPEALKELSQKFERFETLSADVVALTADVAKFQAAIPAEAERRQNIQEVLAANKKIEVLEMARKTNNFFGGAGWTHHIWGLFGSKYSKERAAARQEAAQMGMEHSIPATVLSFGNTLSSGKMKAGIAAIEKDLAAGAEKMQAHKGDTAMLALIERKKREAEALIISERQRIVFDKGLTDTLVGIANKKLVEQLNTVVAPNTDTTADAAQEVFGLLERAEAAYKKSPSGNKHLEGIDPAKDMAAIEAVIEGSVWKEIERSLSETATMPAGRFSHLEQVLEGFAAKERLGKKDKQKIREFIIKRLTAALDVLEKERKSLEAKPKGDAQAEMEKRKKLNEFSQRAILTQSLIARERKKLVSERATAAPRPSPPPPPSAPPAPPSTPPSPSSTPLDSLFPKGSTESASGGISSPITKGSTPEGGRISSVSPSEQVPAPERTPETPQTLETFEDIFKLDASLLQKVLRQALTAEQLADVLSDMVSSENPRDTESVRKVYGCLTEEENVQLVGLLTRTTRAYGEVWLNNLKNRLLNTAREVVAKENASEPPLETPPAMSGGEAAPSDFVKKVQGAVERMGGGTSSGEERGGAETPSVPETHRIAVEGVPTAESGGEVPIRTAEPLPVPEEKSKSVSETQRAKSDIDERIAQLRKEVLAEEKAEIGARFGEGKAEQKETLSTAEKIGEVFARFCKGRIEFQIDQFQQELIKEVPNAKVEEVYRSSGAQDNDIYFTRVREASPQRYWLVTMGNQKFVLPRPVRTDRFDDGNAPQGFSGITEDLSPDSLTKFMPTEVTEIGNRIEVKTPGWFNKPPQAETL